MTSFSLYNDYCAGSTAASALVRSIAHRSDYEAFEKRCQFIASTSPHPTLRDILHHRVPKPARTRLRFKDILITPVQRVCRYPLLLASLLADVNVNRDVPPTPVMSAVEAAQASMRAVAENADDARQRKEAELKTMNVLDRLEPHPTVNYDFVRRLGVCRLIGALDVLYHHPVHAPLVQPPVKVKYLAAFLYRGYLILAKIRRGKTFELKHYLPLEAFELIDITEGELASLHCTADIQAFFPIPYASPCASITSTSLPHVTLRRSSGPPSCALPVTRALSHRLNFPRACPCLHRVTATRRPPFPRRRHQSLSCTLLRSATP